MKKIILSVIAIIVFGFVNAQEVKFGVKGGGNVSNFSGDVEGFNSRVGFNVGAFAEIKLSDKFALQPEVLYSQQGAKIKVAGSIYDGFNYQHYRGTLKYNLGYINMPIMFKYYAIENFALQVGPQIGFLTFAKGRAKHEGVTSEISIKDFYETIDFGLNFGASYDFTKNIFVETRYNLGISNIAQNEIGDTSKVHNSVFSLSLGYKF
ncbi:porin family protein [Flavobacterium pectinovorum]|uniref:PorT family protein n=1 Tax=Flavobacterium pectinovorum TaxID=29533 RepID=A0A502ELG0_9FLAO|nr:porin family protein [Flavobacterium pectinovorum]TPG37822.1 PorT family protein [Flavobacterium pectinovorum]